MDMQALRAKLLSLGFQEKTYDHSEGVFISLTQTVGNTPFCTPEYVKAQDYGNGSLYYGHLITMELTPEGKFQCAGLGDAHDYFCLTECDQSIIDMVVAYYEQHKPFTNMQWCFIDVDGRIATINFDQDQTGLPDFKSFRGDKLIYASSSLGGKVMVDKKSYTVWEASDFDGVGCAIDDEYTLYGSLHDLAMVLEA